MRADAWSAYGEDDILYCSECWLDSDPDLVQCEECLECEADGATGIVYNAGIGAMGFLCTDSVSHYAVCGGTRYCLDCYDDWLLSEGQVGEGSAKRMRTATEGAAAANTARNEKNMALLQEWFPAHCPYHLYFHHVRNTRTCEYGNADKCVKGSHAAPPGLAMKASGLDLGVDK